MYMHVHVHVHVHVTHLKMMQLFVVEPEVHSVAGGCGQFHRDTPSAAPL